MTVDLDDLLHLVTGRYPDWRTTYSTAPSALPDLYAGDPPPAPNPIVTRWECQQCNRRYLGQPTLQPSCPECHGPLQQTEAWDLRSDAFGPVLVRRERQRYKRN